MFSSNLRSGKTTGFNLRMCVYRQAAGDVMGKAGEGKMGTRTCDEKESLTTKCMPNAGLLVGRSLSALLVRRGLHASCDPRCL